MILLGSKYPVIFLKNLSDDLQLIYKLLMENYNNRNRREGVKVLTKLMCHQNSGA